MYESSGRTPEDARPGITFEINDCASSLTIYAQDWEAGCPNGGVRLTCSGGNTARWGRVNGDDDRSNWHVHTGYVDGAQAVSSTSHYNWAAPSVSMGGHAKPGMCGPGNTWTFRRDMDTTGDAYLLRTMLTINSRVAPVIELVDFIFICTSIRMNIHAYTTHNNLGHIDIESHLLAAACIATTRNKAHSSIDNHAHARIVKVSYVSSEPALHAIIGGVAAGAVILILFVVVLSCYCSKKKSVKEIETKTADQSVHPTAIPMAVFASHSVSEDVPVANATPVE